MAYELLINPAGYDTTPQEFATCLAPELLFSQIFTGTPQFYAGSTFTVEEILEFYVTVQDDTLIDKDFIWYPPKLYLGTWSLFSQLSGFGTNPENRGFLEDTITQVTRYSTYTIQGNADVPIAVHEQSAIDGCNFQLISVEVGVPPLQVQGSALFDPVAAFKSRNTLQRVPLIDQPFNRKIKYVGIATRPGCLCTGILYKARIINAISVDLPEFPLTTCFYAPPANCPLQFANFLSATSGAYNNQLVCESTESVPCDINVYVCPTDPTQTFNYWTPSGR
jgi:hypothetical protein